MNGKTKHDATLNPCMAAFDKNTRGFRWLNITFWGNRLFACTLGPLHFDIATAPSRAQRALDVRKGAVKRFMYVRVANAGILFGSLGTVSWPMPRKRRRV